MNKTAKNLKWDFEAVISDSDLQDQMREVEQQVDTFVNKWRKQTGYLSDPTLLLEALQDFSRLWEEQGIDGDFGYYYSMRSAIEQDSTEVKAALAKIAEFSSKQSNKLNFFTLNLGKIDQSQQQVFLSDDRLKLYRKFLQRLFDAAQHDLSEEQEEVMSLKSQTSFGKWVDMLSTMLSEEEVEVDGEVKTLPELRSMLQSTTKSTRDAAAQQVHDSMRKFAPIAEHELNAILTDKKINDQIRKFSRPDSARHLSDDVTSEMVDSLVTAVTAAYDISQDYYKFKAQLLGQQQLGYHERSVPIGDVGEGEYSYAKSLNLVKDVFAGLDSDFVEIVNKFEAGKQIDVYPRKGKIGGAFCAHNRRSHPVYVLLNHTDELRDVLTMAHEFGHGINDELMRQNQPEIYYGTSLATAEVASTFFEDFVLQRLMAEADDETRFALMIQKLDDEIATIIRQIAAYNFETKLHALHREAGYLSHAQIGEIFQENMAAYMGDGVSQDPGAENWWVWWGHFRRFFYVYSYASGLLISKNLQAKVKQDKSYINEVKKFLGTGTSLSPQDTFAQIGVDITTPNFWETGLQEVRDLLQQTTQLAEDLDKLS